MPPNVSSYEGNIGEKARKEKRKQRTRTTTIGSSTRGTHDINGIKTTTNRSLLLQQRASSLSKLSQTVKPETLGGWITLLSSISSAILWHEIRLQKKLTSPPLVFSQDTHDMKKLRDHLSHNPKSSDGKGILTRNIKPSLLVGTRGVLASTAAYILHGPPRERHLHFRETVTMGDGATIALDWEIPHPRYYSTVDVRLSESQLKANVLYGPIDLPVVIIMHGINNDTGFGYMKSLMRSCANKGWIACGMNFRGCGGQKLTTPRGYNAAYTGDLRWVVQSISTRLKHKGRGGTPVFLVGNSLGANIMTKYLGEEGLSRTLPDCIHGGVSLGNPLHINSGNVPFPYNMLLSAGVKKSYIENWNVIHKMSSCFHFSDAIRNALLSRTIGQLDQSMSPFLIRNESTYPFHAKVGYEDGEDYWHDASSNRYIPHVTVPLMILSAQDDSLVTDPALRSLSRCLENPNILVVKTKCGGHLGWQEASPRGYGIGKSWADTAMTDFFEAVLEMEMKSISKVEQDDSSSGRISLEGRENKTNNPTTGTTDMDIVENMYASKSIHSRL